MEALIKPLPSLPVSGEPDLESWQLIFLPSLSDDAHSDNIVYLANTRIEPATDAEEALEEVTIWQPWKEEWQGREEYSNEIAHHERTKKEGEELPLNQSLEREAIQTLASMNLIHEKKVRLLIALKGHSNKRTIAFLNQGGKEKLERRK